MPVPTGVGAEAFSQESQGTFKLWADLHLSDEDVEDRFTDNKDSNKHQTPLLTVPGKCSRLGSDDEKSPSKKAKLDVSNLYGAASGTSNKGVGTTGKGDGAAVQDDGATGAGSGGLRVEIP